MIKPLSQLEFLVEQLPNASTEQLPYFTEQLREILDTLKAKGVIVLLLPLQKNQQNPMTSS
jgi:hypothetical protein